MSERLIDRIDQWLFLNAPGPVLAVIDVWKKLRRYVEEKLTELCLWVVRRLNRGCDRMLSHDLHELGALYATRPELIVELPDSFNGDFERLDKSCPFAAWLPAERESVFVDVSVVDDKDAVARIEEYRTRLSGSDSE